VSGLAVSAAGGVATVVFRRRSQPEADGDADPNTDVEAELIEPSRVRRFAATVRSTMAAGADKVTSGARNLRYKTRRGTDAETPGTAADPPSAAVPG
jgi:hypothetical protein